MDTFSCTHDSDENSCANGGTPTRVNDLNKHSHNVLLNTVSPIRLYAAKCMLGLKKSFAGIYSTKANSRVVTASKTQVNQVQSETAVPSIVANQQVDTLPKIPDPPDLSHYTAVQNSSEAEAKLLHDQVRIVTRSMCKRTKEKAITAEDLSHSLGVPTAVICDVIVVMEVAGRARLSQPDSMSYFVNSQSSMVSYLTSYRSPTSRSDPDWSVVSPPPISLLPHSGLLGTAPPTSIPSLFSVSDLNISTLVHSLPYHGAAITEQLSDGYPLRVQPLHYNYPYLSEEPREITMQRVLPESLPQRIPIKSQTTVELKKMSLKRSESSYVSCQSVAKRERVPIYLTKKHPVSVVDRGSKRSVRPDMRASHQELMRFATQSVLTQCMQCDSTSILSLSEGLQLTDDMRGMAVDTVRLVVCVLVELAIVVVPEYAKNDITKLDMNTPICCLFSSRVVYFLLFHHKEESLSVWNAAANPSSIELARTEGDGMITSQQLQVNTALDTSTCMGKENSQLTDSSNRLSVETLIRKLWNTDDITSDYMASLFSSYDRDSAPDVETVSNSIAERSKCIVDIYSEAYRNFYRI